MNLYTHYSVDDINIWKDDNLNPYSNSKPITIELEKWWLFNKLTIDGAKPIANHRCM